MKRVIIAALCALALLLATSAAAFAANPQNSDAATNAPALGHTAFPGNGNGYGLTKGVGEGSVIHAPADTGGGPGGAY